MSSAKYADLVVLLAALAVFVLADLPMIGYAATAAVWLAQRGIQVLAARRAQSELAAGERQRAMGIVAATTLGRVWLIATVVLVTGLLGDREDGLAQGLAHLFEPEGEGAR
jgi:hypothetical protein